MAYHDDLLVHALELVHFAPANQLTLRRAVSAAYYAVFHYLIAEATANWSNVLLRNALARAYDHGIMKTASNRILNSRDFPYLGEDPIVVSKLKFVAQTFSQLQDDRHFADYNLTKDLDPREALRQVELAKKIFDDWPTIRTEQIAQAFLVSLLVKRF